MLFVARRPRGSLPQQTELPLNRRAFCRHRPVGRVPSGGDTSLCLRLASLSRSAALRSAGGASWSSTVKLALLRRRVKHTVCPPSLLRIDLIDKMDVEGETTANLVSQLSTRWKEWRGKEVTRGDAGWHDSSVRRGASALAREAVVSRLYNTVTITPCLSHTHTHTYHSVFLHRQVSKDGDSFTVPLAVAKMSELVKSMMDGTCTREWEATRCVVLFLLFLQHLPWWKEIRERRRMELGIFSTSHTPGQTATPTTTMMTTEDAEEEGTNIEIPLPNVKSQVLQKVIEFCEHHLQEPMTEIEKPLKSQVMADVVQKWYADFVDLEQVLLFELILAANYMDIKPLLDLTCATVASMIKGKSPEEIRSTFNITNDFSPEEEAQVREENKWCEEA
jgi:S-phase kinase-associated protein 1